MPPTAVSARGINHVVSANAYATDNTTFRKKYRIDKHQTYTLMIMDNSADEKLILLAIPQ